MPRCAPLHRFMKMLSRRREAKVEGKTRQERRCRHRNAGGKKDERNGWYSFLGFECFGRGSPTLMLSRIRTDQAGIRFLPVATTCLAACLLAVQVRAQDKNPFTGDAQAAKIGESQFRANCAFCHGLGARGGGRGPDLTRAQKKHVHSDAEMFQVISNGIPGTVMPANGSNGQGVGMTDEEIWQIIAYIRSVEVKASGSTGDASH